MISKDISPRDALPTVDRDPTDYFRRFSKLGAWEHVPRAQVFKLEESDRLYKSFRTHFLIFDGNTRRATAQECNQVYRVNILEPSDFENFNELLLEAKLNAERHYNLDLLGL